MARGSKLASITALFDYDSLEATQRSIIQQRTGEIRERLRRSAQDVWEIGQKLADVRSRLKYGQFLTWLKVEFGWSQRTAYNFIKVYETFGDRFANLAKVDIATSLLYQLASPSVPDDLRDQVLQAAEQGQKITAKSLRSAIKKRKQLKSAVVEGSQLADEANQSGPEIITVISQGADPTPPGDEPHAAVELGAVRPVLAESVLHTPLEIEPGWYQLDGRHLIFHGDTASHSFTDQAPVAKLAIAFTGSDWAHDWLIDQVDNVVVLPQSEFTLEKLEQLLLLLSGPQDEVIFPWLPHPEMVFTAHRLERRVYGGDVDGERCRRAIVASGLRAQAIKMEYAVEQVG
ncbi:MAG: DUF3102 domain-containing protein [Cyanobacteria bacterium P01_F01_bin.4]